MKDYKNCTYVGINRAPKESPLKVTVTFAAMVGCVIGLAVIMTWFTR